MLWDPEVHGIRRAATPGPSRGNAEGVDRAAAAVGLREDRARRAVAEAAHAAEPPEVVVEGTVLLDHDDDVLDVGQPRRRRPRGEAAGERIGDEPGAQREARGEKLAACETRVTHGAAV